MKYAVDARSLANGINVRKLQKGHGLFLCSKVETKHNATADVIQNCRLEHVFGPSIRRALGEEEGK